jgi:hypothetical protein
MGKDQVPMTNASEKFPPEGFAVVSQPCVFWMPKDGETLRGYVCDVRKLSIGLLLETGETRHVLSGDHEEIGSLASLLVEQEVQEQLPGQAPTSRIVVLTSEVALRWHDDPGAYEVAMALGSPAPLSGVVRKIAEQIQNAQKKELAEKVAEVKVATEKVAEALKNYSPETLPSPSLTEKLAQTPGNSEAATPVLAP